MFFVSGPCLKARSDFQPRSSCQHGIRSITKDVAKWSVNNVDNILSGHQQSSTGSCSVGPMPYPQMVAAVSGLVPVIATFIESLTCCPAFALELRGDVDFTVRLGCLACVITPKNPVNQDRVRQGPMRMLVIHTGAIYMSLAAASLTQSTVTYVIISSIGTQVIKLHRWYLWVPF